jgi:cytidylate kinase
MRRRGIVVAMDGPAGVGKSTVGQLVAKSLGCRFINTGEMYRALTWKALEEGLEIGNHRAILALAHRLRWDFRPAQRGPALKTWLDGCLVTTQIHSEKVSKMSSLVAANPGVRRFLCRLQRGLGAKGAIVMEGRDITTHVFPDADFKIYLDASVEERSRRRYRQLKAAGQKADLKKIREAILERDLSDQRRKINPLIRAQDAVVIDSTRLTLHQVARKILRVIHRGC